MKEAYKLAEYFDIVQTAARDIARPHEPTYFQPPSPAAQSSTDMSSSTDLDAILQITYGHCECYFEMQRRRLQLQGP